MVEGGDAEDVTDTSHPSAADPPPARRPYKYTNPGDIAYEPDRARASGKLEFAAIERTCRYQTQSVLDSIGYVPAEEVEENYRRSWWTRDAVAGVDDNGRRTSWRGSLPDRIAEIVAVRREPEPGCRRYDRVGSV